MYNDHRSVNRTEWKYTYPGSELLPFAQRKLQEHALIESNARTVASELLADKKVSRDDRRVVKAEEEIKTHGDLAEKCRVWVHQFKREPDRDFHLALGDVTYFGIIDGEPTEDA